MNAEQYKVMLGTHLCNELHPCRQDLPWLQQDGATAHTAQISIQVLKTVCLSRLIFHFGYITWSTHSHELTVPDYFLWSHVKSKVYETCPANIAHFKQQILECIQGIPNEMLRVMTAFPSQLQECAEQHAGGLQSVIIKQ